MPSTAGYLYINFERNRNRLEDQLRDIRKLHADKLFPTLHSDTNILDYFVESAFEYDAPGKFLLSNTSLKPNRYKMTLRPVPTEILDGEFPPGVTLCLRGVLMPPHHASPELLVERIIDIGASGAKPFEIEIPATPQPSSTHRPKNILTAQLLDKIPEISRKTRHQLEDWKNYLQWRKEIIEQELCGLRYISITALDGELKIRAIAENEKAFRELEKSLRREEMLLFPLSYSTDDWHFRYNRDSGYMNPLTLGNLRDSKYVDDAIVPDHLKCPWIDPFVVDLTFGLAKGGYASKNSDRDLSEQGFLATSLIGDLTVLQRQASAIFELELQSGYAPFLSSWLFDIESANTPQIAAPVTTWLNQNINQDQKQAVKKLLEAPDVALIQGPPGTGKTTVIAEAIYQYTRQGKKVLLASQANLAVDNALEKIGYQPEIRPVRLGRSRKFSEGGQQFAEDAVLNRFYGTIARSCETKYLPGLREDEVTLRELEKSLAGLEAMSDAMSQIKQEIAALRDRAEDDDGQLAKQQLAEQKIIQMRSLRQNLLELAACLKGESADKILVPTSLEKVIDAAIMTPLLQLKRYKIDLCVDQAQSFGVVYSNWLELKSKITVIKSDAERFGRGASHVMISVANREQALQLREEIETLEERIEAGETDLRDDWRQSRRKLRRLHDVSRLDAGLYRSVFTLRDNGIPFAERLLNPQIERQKLVSFLQHSLQALHTVSAQLEKSVPLISGNIGKLVEQIAILEKQQKAALHKGAASQIDDTRADLEADLHRQEEELQDRLQKLELKNNGKGQPSEALLENAIRLLREKIEARRSTDENTTEDKWRPFLQWWVDLLRSPQQAENDDAEVLPLYLQNCNVVGITCNENRRNLEDRGFSRFDVTIIDEVSKATPPELLMPMMLAKKTILVGDHRQLPPVFKEQQGSWLESVEEPQGSRAATLLTADNYLKFKQMVTASLFREYFETAPAAIKTTLLTQYRMHPDIMQVINPFYHYRLRCGLENPDEERKHGLSINTTEDLPLITPETHAVWVDSSRDPANKLHFEKQSGTSKLNMLEIELMITFLRKLNKAAHNQGFEERQPKDIGVISFYAKQVWRLRQRVRAENLPALNIEVNTVDRFQGKEKSVILVSLVRHPGSGRSVNSAFVTQFERINVAFSRARELLVIFGARRMFADCEIPIPLAEGDGMESKKVYGEIIENLNRSSNLWTSGSLITPSEYQQLDLR